MSARGILVGLLRVILVMAALVLLMALLLAAALYGSRAKLSGAVSVPGMDGTVTVSRDAQGVPTLEAGTALDAARSLGFVHAQERFFQMDLLRRRGAGDLAELVGPAVVESDVKTRIHEIRRRADEALARLAPEELRWIEAYTTGVNEGLKALPVRPPEYLLLRQRPRPWQPADSLAVMMAMAFALQDPEGVQETMLGVMSRTLSPAAFAFFAPRGTEWDAALDGSEEPAAPVPSSDEFSAPPVSTHATARGEPSSRREEMPGSNAWAVHGRRTSGGGALIADDMHLDLRLPNYWYRAVIRWSDTGGRRRQLSGVTLPGMPYLVTGSNGDVAWGFTNAQVDETDIIELETDAAHPGKYRTPLGWKAFEVRTEDLPVAGAPGRRVAHTNTIWGPVVDAGVTDGRLRVAHWVYHEPESWRVRYAALMRATNVAQALQAAPANPIPVQNFVVGDREGNIGWTLMGPLPRRAGFDGRLPGSWADGTHRWVGLKAPSDHPRVLNPSEGLIWTANQRVDGSPAYREVGDGFPDNGARAGQIRDDLRSLPQASPTHLLAIQLDDRAPFFDRWQHLLLQTLDRPAGTNGPAFAAARSWVANWGGRADPESVGFRLVAGFRSRVEQRVSEPVITLCRQQCPGFFLPGSQFERPLWTLLQERPPHLLNRRYASWDALLEDAAAEVVSAGMRHPGGLKSFTWGGRQRFQLRHPISLAVPALGRWLDFAPEELPGAPIAMPRIQGSDFGASERFVVSPGREQEGIYHMPGGQSGHFLSPFYRAGHTAWANGEPTPFLPGTERYRLTLNPPRKE